MENQIGTKPMINMKNIKKRFADKIVLNDVSFYVDKGEIFGLLGPSGAGKTTIINILTKQIHPDSGTADVNAEPSVMGIMLEYAGIYSHLSCIENLNLYNEIYALPKENAKQVLETVGLGDEAKTSVSKLSRGMMQRVALARAILTKPKLLFLDEPTSALDPSTAKKIGHLLEGMRQNGTTIFLTTHNMDEALKLCDRVALLHDGKIVEQGNPTEICNRYNAVRTVPDLERVFLEVTGVEL